MNVHDLNNEKPAIQDSYKSLQLLNEISKGEPVSQRDLSKKLNLALGLVNSYLKNLISRGYVTISAIPAKRYTYYLTPKGFSEKKRLTYHLLQEYTNIYKTARRDFRGLFHDLSLNGTKKIVFAGVDEVTDIAYLSLQEFDIELSGVFDDLKEDIFFFKRSVLPFQALPTTDYDRVILSTYFRKEEIYRKLLNNMVPVDKILTIHDVFPGSK